MGLGHNGYGPIKAHSILIEINPTWEHKINI
jgi:hypothetical protein